MNKELVFAHIGYSILAAVLYIIPMVIFISQADFVATWWLYAGNALFGAGVSIFMLRHIQVKKKGGSTTSMVSAGHIVTIAGIVIVCIAILPTLLLFDPGLFSSGAPDDVLTGAPATMQEGKSNGLILVLFMNAFIGNATAGSFVSIIFSYAAKINQTRDQESSLLKEDKVNRW